MELILSFYQEMLFKLLQEIFLRFAQVFLLKCLQVIFRIWRRNSSNIISGIHPTAPSKLPYKLFLGIVSEILKKNPENSSNSFFKSSLWAFCPGFYPENVMNIAEVSSRNHPGIPSANTSAVSSENLSAVSPGTLRSSF